MKLICASLTLIWVGFLGGSFFLGGRRGVKLSTRLKLVRIMLKTSQIWHVSTLYICTFRKYTFQYQGSLNFADVSIIFAKNQRFLTKIAPLLKAIV